MDKRKMKTRMKARANTLKNNCTTLPATDSAYLNVRTAKLDCRAAQVAWEDSKWEEAVMFINMAISQLESARAKIITASDGKH